MSDLEPSELEDRRAARERALQLLYEAEIKGSTVDDVLAELPVVPAALTVELVRGVAAHAERIDEILARRVAPRWTLVRLAALDRAVLRLGTYELLDRPDRSQAVIINEAVVLARRFGTDDSPRFVNGVLSAVAAEVRDRANGPAPGADNPGRDRGPVADPGSAAGDLEALIVDLDGVIRHWDERSLAEAEAALGLPAGAVHDAAFAPVRYERAMQGEISFEEWRADVGEAVAATYGVAADAVAKAFGETRWSIDGAVLDLVDRVRRRVPVALLSNASSRLSEELQRAGIADRFDTVVVSAAIGHCKPAAEAFLAAAARLGIPPDRCLVVDDQAVNVSGALAAGLPAVRYVDVDTLRGDLASAGLLAPDP